MTGEAIHSGKELYGNVDVLGMSAAELCRRIGVPGDQAKRLKDLEKENGRLRKANSDLTLDKLILKEALEGNC